MIDASTREELTQQLLAKQSDLRTRLTAAQTPEFSDINAGQPDEDAEEDEAEESASREAITEAIRRDLAAVDAALGRIDQGAYGRCASCGKDIDIERLRAFPEAERCVNCQ